MSKKWAEKGLLIFLGKILGKFLGNFLGFAFLIIFFSCQQDSSPNEVAASSPPAPEEEPPVVEPQIIVEEEMVKEEVEPLMLVEEEMVEEEVEPLMLVEEEMVEEEMALVEVELDLSLLSKGLNGLVVAKVGRRNFLFVSEGRGDQVSVFWLRDDGTLAGVGEVSDDGELELDGASALATAQVGGNTYLFVAGEKDDGISVFRVGVNGTLANTDNVSDDEYLELEGASGLATAQVGGNTYLFVAGEDDDGISMFRVGEEVGEEGKLLNLTNVTNMISSDADLTLVRASGVTTALVGETTYLFVAAHGKDRPKTPEGKSMYPGAVSVFRIGNEGTLANTYNVHNGQMRNGRTVKLKGASSLTTAEIGSQKYLFVGLHDSDEGNDYGVSYFSIGDDGTLTRLGHGPDSDDLRGIEDIATAEAEGTTYLFLGNRSGLSVFEAVIGNDGELSLNGGNHHGMYNRALGVTTIEEGGDDLCFSGMGW